MIANSAVLDTDYKERKKELSILEEKIGREKGKHSKYTEVI